MDKIFESTRSFYAKKIQRNWRRYKRELDLIRAAEERRLELMKEEAKQVCVDVYIYIYIYYIYVYVLLLGAININTILLYCPNIYCPIF